MRRKHVPAREIREYEKQYAREHPPEPQPEEQSPEYHGIWIPKHWLLIGQLIRTIASSISAIGTMVILLRVFGAL